MKFNIRDLLWLIVVFALAAGWFVDHRKQLTVIGEADRECDRKRWDIQDASIAQAKGLLRTIRERDEEIESLKETIAGMVPMNR